MVAEGSDVDRLEAAGRAAVRPPEDRPPEERPAVVDRARRLGRDPRAPSAVAVLVGAIVRLWLVRGRAALWRPDSERYLELSRLPLTDRDRWAGPRTPLVPLLLDLTGGAGTGFVLLQLAVAALGWGFLAHEVSRFAPTAARRWSLAGLVLALSLTTPVVLWDRLVLTETITLALMAAMVALLLRHLRTRSTAALVAVVPVAAAWAAARDTVAVVLLAGALTAVVAWAIGGRRRRLVPVVAVLVAGVGLASLAGASVGHRDRSPLANVFAVRVLPYEDRLAWFEDHGMPEGERFRQAREHRRERGLDQPGEAPIVPISRRDQATDPWWRWLEEDGKRTYLEFVLTHPTYLLAEPLKDPQRSFHSAGGHTAANFEAPDLRRVPLLHRLWFRTSVVELLLVAAGAAWFATGRRRHPLAAVAALTTLAGSLYGLAAWHGDGMEAARHVFVGGAALRVALVLAIACVVVQVRVPRESVAAEAGDGPPEP